MSESPGPCGATLLQRGQERRKLYEKQIKTVVIHPACVRAGIQLVRGNADDGKRGDDPHCQF